LDRQGVNIYIQESADDAKKKKKEKRKYHDCKKSIKKEKETSAEAEPSLAMKKKFENFKCQLGIGLEDPARPRSSSPAPLPQSHCLR